MRNYSILFHEDDLPEVPETDDVGIDADPE
jgi:hypothetical protein